MRDDRSQETLVKPGQLYVVGFGKYRRESSTLTFNGVATASNLIFRSLIMRSMVLLLYSPSMIVETLRP